LHIALLSSIDVSATSFSSNFNRDSITLGSTGPYDVKNEVVKASREAWADLTPEARSLVGTLWADKTGVDLVVTTLDPVQTKEKILSMIADILEQKKRYPLGRAQTPPR